MPAKNPKITTETAHHLHTLGARIRAQRKKLELNATVAAEAAAMSRITWYRIEKGEPAVTMPNTRPFSDAVNRCETSEAIDGK